VVVDRFHVAKNFRECGDKARKLEMHVLKKTLSDEKYAELKGVMWVFRKSWITLTEEEQSSRVRIAYHYKVFRLIKPQKVLGAYPTWLFQEILLYYMHLSLLSSDWNGV
jgi:transposase